MLRNCQLRFGTNLSRIEWSMLTSSHIVGSRGKHLNDLVISLLVDFVTDLTMTLFGFELSGVRARLLQEPLA